MQFSGGSVSSVQFVQAQGPVQVVNLAGADVDPIPEVQIGAGQPEMQVEDGQAPPLNEENPLAIVPFVPHVMDPQGQV